jgi:hypothetical protein
VSKLRENAKKVIGVGVKQSTSDLLVANCDEFIFYDDLVRESRRARRDASPDAKPQVKRTPEEERARREEMEKRRSQAVEIAVNTFEALVLERGDSGKIWASVLKEAIKRRKPDFSESYYGFRTFGNLIEECKARGYLEFGRDEKSGAYVYRGSGVPQPASERQLPPTLAQLPPRRQKVASRNRAAAATAAAPPPSASPNARPSASHSSSAIRKAPPMAMPGPPLMPLMPRKQLPPSRRPPPPRGGTTRQRLRRRSKPCQPRLRQLPPQRSRQRLPTRRQRLLRPKKSGAKPPARKLKEQAKKGKAAEAVVAAPAEAPAPAPVVAEPVVVAEKEAKPARPAKAKSKPKAKPAADKPAAHQPAADKAAADKPAADKPAADKPPASRPLHAPRPPKAKAVAATPSEE